jgi:hypothetical protein
MFGFSKVSFKFSCNKLYVLYQRKNSFRKADSKGYFLQGYLCYYLLYYSAFTQTTMQCCGSGSGQIRTFQVEHGRSGADLDQSLQKWTFLALTFNRTRIYWFYCTVSFFIKDFLWKLVYDVTVNEITRLCYCKNIKILTFRQAHFWAQKKFSFPTM